MPWWIVMIVCHRPKRSPDESLSWESWSVVHHQVAFWLIGAGLQRIPFTLWAQPCPRPTSRSRHRQANRKPFGERCFCLANSLANLPCQFGKLTELQQISFCPRAIGDLLFYLAKFWQTWCQVLVCLLGLKFTRISCFKENLKKNS